LSFDNALSAGREQLENIDRSFEFAIDIAVAHYAWKIEPLALRNFDGNNIKPELQQTINSVVASGKGAIAIGGSANGAIINTGDGNVLGNNNTAQKLEQKGKYNINLGNARNLNIGDTIDRDRE
jgi:hypothetical protein